MKKILLPVFLLLVGLGLGYLVPHGAKPGAVGGASKLDSHFVYGLSAGLSDQLIVDSSGNASTTGSFTASAFKLTSTGYAVSSTSPAALSAATGGQFTVAAGATTANASTTALNLNSLLFVQQS